MGVVEAVQVVADVINRYDVLGILVWLMLGPGMLYFGSWRSSSNADWPVVSMFAIFFGVLVSVFPFIMLAGDKVDDYIKRRRK